MDVFKAISDFQLKLLSPEWAEKLWSTEFEGENKIPVDYDSRGPNYLLLLNNLTGAINGWNTNHKKTWHTLIHKNTNYKALISLISVFLDKDSQEITNKQCLAFASAKLYFALLSIPGAMACNIFNSLLFEQALKILNDSISPLVIKTKKSSKKKRPDSSSEDRASGSSQSTNVLPEKKQDEIIKEVSLMLDELSICLTELHLIDEEDTLSETIQVLVKLTQLECEINVFVISPKRNTTGEIILKSYNILEQLCNEKHGEMEKTIKFILRFFLPCLVINEETVKITGKSNVLTNNVIMVFISRLLRTFEKNAVNGVKAMVQQLCLRMPDKADLRAKAVPQIVQILKYFTYNHFEDMIQWIVSMAHSDTVKYRLCAIEIIAKVMDVSDIPESSSSSEGTSTETTGMDLSLCYGEENQLKLLYKFLLSAVLSRTLDASPILRSKCFNVLGSLVLSNQCEIKEIMKDIFITPYKSSTPVTFCANEEYFDFIKYFSTKLGNSPLPVNPLPSGQCIMRHSEMFTRDSKVFVRKNALQFISNICLLNKYWLSGSRLEILVIRSKDISLMIRKMVVKCLTDVLLLYPSDNTLVTSWVQGVVSLVADSDIKSQEKVIESIKSVILENLSTYDKMDSPLTKLPWIVLSTIALTGKRFLFKYACRTWSINKSITKKTFQCLQSHIGTENNFAAWFFIVCLTEFEDFPSPQLFVEYFYENVFCHEAEECLSQLVVEAIFLNWSGFNLQTQNEVHSKLKLSIETFSVPLFVISRYLDICYLANKDETKAWSGHLVKLCETYLKKYNDQNSQSNQISEITITCCIHTLGDAAHFHPGVSMEIINFLAIIIDSTFTVPAMENVGEQQVSTERWKGSVGDVTKAVAVVALGKVCLQDHFLAKQYAKVFANVLNEDSKTAVKINAMAALADLCVRFTSVVEDNLGAMCVMLKDSNHQVRTHSLKLILQLIQEDYLKANKGSLFFYLLIMLRDPVQTVREMMEEFFNNMLLKRHPSIMCQYFMQALFFFNDFEGPKSFDKRVLSANERRVFSMAGATNFNNRGQIYKFMLSNMRDDHRFTLSNLLCNEILSEINKGKIPLNRVGVSILKDAFFALGCDEMRLENLRKPDEEPMDKEIDDVNDFRGGESVLGIAKKVFISQIVKTNYMESIIPTFYNLREKLRSLRSPLAEDLMVCLRALVKDFRNELNDLLHPYTELAAELEMDLRNSSQDEDPLSDHFIEVRVQCEQLTERALCEKMGIATAMRPLQPPFAIPRPSSSLIQQIQLEMPHQEQQSSHRSNLPNRSSSPCSFSSASSQMSPENSSSKADKREVRSLSPAFSSKDEEITLQKKKNIRGAKRLSDEISSDDE